VAFDLLRNALSAIFGLSELKEINEVQDQGYIGGRYFRSHLKDSTFTYTAVSSPFEGLSDIGSLGVDGPPMMPEDPYAYVVAVPP
ncbi:hypothetical protein Tco_1523224, partial [Tanacetum coccineum]